MQAERGSHAVFNPDPLDLEHRLNRTPAPPATDPGESAARARRRAWPPGAETIGAACRTGTVNGFSVSVPPSPTRLSRPQKLSRQIFWGETRLRGGDTWPEAAESPLIFIDCSTR